MAEHMPNCLSTAVVQGDLTVVSNYIKSNGESEIEKKSKDGMTPLSVAAFWGYSNIADLLLQHGANINSQNTGTLWTPLHCATFQGHGPVVMKLMPHSPNLELKDTKGRTAVDFASASDTVWPFFAASGCKRTSQAQLINMDIVYRSLPNSEQTSPTSSPQMNIKLQPRSYQQQSHSYTKDVAAITGDVLAGELHAQRTVSNAPTLTVYEN